MSRSLQSIAYKKRVETGAVRFGADSPGLFICADDCPDVVASLQSVLSHFGEEEMQRNEKLIGQLALLNWLRCKIEREVLPSQVGHASQDN